MALSGREPRSLNATRRHYLEQRGRGGLARPPLALVGRRHRELHVTEREHRREHRLNAARGVGYEAERGERVAKRDPVGARGRARGLAAVLRVEPTGGGAAATTRGA